MLPYADYGDTDSILPLNLVRAHTTKSTISLFNDLGISATLASKLP